MRKLHWYKRLVKRADETWNIIQEDQMNRFMCLKVYQPPNVCATVYYNTQTVFNNKDNI